MFNIWYLKILFYIKLDIDLKNILFFIFNLIFKLIQSITTNKINLFLYYFLFIR